MQERAQTPPSSSRLDAYNIVRALNPNPRPDALQPAHLPTSNLVSPDSSPLGSNAASRKSSLNGGLNFDSPITPMPYSPLRPSQVIPSPAPPRLSITPIHSPRPSMTPLAPAQLSATPINSPLRPSMAAPSPAQLSATPLKEAASLSPPTSTILSPNNESLLLVKKKRLSSSRFSSDGRSHGAQPALQTFHNEDGSRFTDRLNPSPTHQRPSPYLSDATLKERTSAPTGLCLGPTPRPPITPIDLPYLSLGSMLNGPSPSPSFSMVGGRFKSMVDMPKAGRRSLAGNLQDNLGFNLASEARLPASGPSCTSRASDQGSQERKSAPSDRKSSHTTTFIPMARNDSLSFFMKEAKQHQKI